MSLRFKRKLGPVQGRGFPEIGDRLLHRFTLRGGSSLGVQSDKSAFFSRSKDSCQFLGHLFDTSPTTMPLSCPCQSSRAGVSGGFFDSLNVRNDRAPAREARRVPKSDALGSSGRLRGWASSCRDSLLELRYRGVTHELTCFLGLCHLLRCQRSELQPLTAYPGVRGLSGRLSVLDRSIATRA